MSTKRFLIKSDVLGNRDEKESTFLQINDYYCKNNQAKLEMLSWSGD